VLFRSDAAIPQETEAQRLQRRSNGFADPMSIDNNIIDLEAQLEAIKTDPTSSSFFESFLQKARDVQMRFTKTVDTFRSLTDVEKQKQAPKLAGQGLDIINSLESAAEHATTSMLSKIKAISANVVIATGIILFDVACIATSTALLSGFVTLSILSGGTLPLAIIFFPPLGGTIGLVIALPCFALQNPADPKFHYNIYDSTSHLNKTESMTAAAAMGSMKELKIDSKRQEQMKAKAAQYLKELFEITPKDATGKLQLQTGEVLRVKIIIDTLSKLDSSIPKDEYLQQLSSIKPVKK
jgi:ribosomal protein L29